MKRAENNPLSLLLEKLTAQQWTRKSTNTLLEQDDVFVVVDVVADGVFNPQPEGLRNLTMHAIVPLEIRRESDGDLKDGPGDGLEYCVHLQAWNLLGTPAQQAAHPHVA